MATILVADDRPENREYLVTLLARGKHRILEAADGAEALSIASAERPDLIIADILMPTMDGFELVRRLRADPVLGKTPVIFWTAHYHEREAVALARSCGVSEVITKPCKLQTVLNAVEAALGISAPAAAQPVTKDYDRDHLRLMTDKLSQKADDLSATNERLSALVELNLQLASEQDTRRLLQNFGHAARRIIGARYSIIGILNDSSTEFQYLFTSGMDAAAAVKLGSPDVHAALLAPILSQTRCVRKGNPGGDPTKLGLPSSHPPVHSWLGVPIASLNRTYGYIGLSDRIGLEEFSEEDERLAQILAAQVGRIYQNGSLYSEVLVRAADLEREIVARVETEKALAERAQQGLLIGEVGAALTRGDSLREMLQLCARGLIRHLDAAFAGIWIFNRAENTLDLEASAADGAGIDTRHSRIAVGEFKIGLIAQDRTPRFSNDLLNDPEITDKSWVKREGIVAFAGCPLVVEERLLGVVRVLGRRPFSAGNADVLGSVAHEIALGIERIQANEARRESEEHIRLLLGSTAEAIYGIDLEGRCTFANPACARLLGYADPAQLLGRNMHQLIHHTYADGSPSPPDKCRIFEAFRVDQGSHADDEFFWRAGGSMFPVEYWSHPVRRGGQVVGAVVAFLDITERRRLEDQFRQAEQRLREVVASSPAVLFTLTIADDSIQGLSWISDNVQQVFGYTPDAAIGADWWLTNVHPDDVERIMSQIRAEMAASGHSTQEYRFRHGDGAHRWTRCDMRFVRDQSGQTTGAVGAWLDITERKRTEEEQAALRAQLQQAQKLETIGRLAGGVAHDFNNLLTVINGYAEMAIRKLNPGDPMRENVAEILKAGQLAAKLTQQLSLLSRKQVTEVRPVNLNDVVVEVQKMLARVIGDDIRLDLVLNPALECVLADPGQLNQVLMNLAVNARDAMPKGGTLAIETGNIDLDETNVEHHAEVKAGPHVQIKVSDTGTGMTKDVMAHLFEPFFTTKGPGEGTGLGLAIVYGIVKQCEGSIRVHSEPGKGTTFTIYIPRVAGAVALPQAPAQPPQSLHGTETILVVEDQEQLRKMAAGVLRSYGYRVLESANPGEALLLSQRHAGPIHLLLSDVVMPGMTGPELAARLKPSRPAMELVFMSGYIERAIVDRMQLPGSYLPKPFSPDALATKVRELLGAPRTAGTILVVDKDSAVRTLLRVDLSRLGYGVLEAANGREAQQMFKTDDVDLVIADVTAQEHEDAKTLRAMRQARPQLRIIAMSAGSAGPRPRSRKVFDAHALLAKPIRLEDLADAVASAMKVREKSYEN